MTKKKWSRNRKPLRKKIFKMSTLILTIFLELILFFLFFSVFKWWFQLIKKDLHLNDLIFIIWFWFKWVNWVFKWLSQKNGDHRYCWPNTIIIYRTRDYIHLLLFIFRYSSFAIHLLRMFNKHALSSTKYKMNKKIFDKNIFN